MAVTVFITIDTEEDAWGNWLRENNSVENVSRIPQLQKIFDRYGAKPTYLASYPVLLHKESTAMLKETHETGRCGIGSHFHPWNTPPHEEKTDQYHTMACNLPNELLHRKIDSLSAAFRRAFHVEPTYFRAGRWGFGPNVAEVICNLGYKVDTSITPFCDWSPYDGPDFSDYQVPSLYRFEPENIRDPNPRGSLIEVPPTIGFFQGNIKRCAGLLKWARKRYVKPLRLLGIFNRLRILNLRWLSPELNDGPGMIRLAEAFVRQGHLFLNLSFHSTSLLPGKSPFVRSNEDLNEFIYRIEIFMDFCLRKNFIFSPLNGALCG